MEAPRKPVMIYDGDCRFCGHFVAQWRQRTGDRIEYQTREAAQSWILDEFYQRSAGAVLLMMPTGQFYEGAEAVFKVRALGGLGLGLWLFQHVPAAKWLSKCGYALIAKNRMFFSHILRLNRSAAK